MDALSIDASLPSFFLSFVALLLLAYTNRFIHLSSMIRKLLLQYRDNPETHLLKEIHWIGNQLRLCRAMKITGLVSLICCTLSIAAIYLLLPLVASGLFAVALVMILISLGICLVETWFNGSSVLLELTVHQASEAEKRPCQTLNAVTAAEFPSSEAA